MSKSSKELHEAESSGSRFLSNVSRRKFLNYAGASAGAMLVASSCSKELRQNPQGDSHLNSEGVVKMEVKGMSILEKEILEFLIMPMPLSNLKLLFTPR
ncbi:MAG: twin-arginine translocation signal domain-containing protein [Chitinophagaceae bacterium]